MTLPPRAQTIAHDLVQELGLRPAGLSVQIDFDADGRLQRVTTPDRTFARVSDPLAGHAGNCLKTLIAAFEGTLADRCTCGADEASWKHDVRGCH